MMELDWLDSIYLLNKEQKADRKQLEQYDVFFSMLRYEYMNNTIAIATMHDIWVYYYYPEKLILNNELTMIYLLRHFVVDKVMSTSRFERIKMHTVGCYTKSLIAAAFTVNLFLDINRKILTQIPKDDLSLMLKYSTGSKMLFKAKFQEFDSYPRKLVKVETDILQLMRQYILDHEKEFEDGILQAVQFMDQYALNEKDIFEKGILK